MYMAINARTVQYLQSNLVSATLTLRLTLLYLLCLLYETYQSKLREIYTKRAVIMKEKQM